MGYDFEADKQYNFETSVSMILELNKTCFTPGEYINGTITLRPKEGDSPPFLQDPRATLYLTEYAYYTYMENEIDPRTNQSTFVSKVAEENIPLLSIPLDFSQFRDTNISSCPKLPFTCQIPLVIYPSCLFGAKTFVKHYLCVDFPFIRAKKTCIIVIKNPPYFSKYNRLLQEPAMCYREKTKHKLFFSQGSFSASIKIPKNAFKYDEKVPFEIDIDLTKMSLDIKNIKVSLRRRVKKNQRYNHNQVFKEEENTAVAKKVCSFNKNDKKIHISDDIIIDQDKSPKYIYDKLDKDNRKVAEKYNGVYLYPTCYGGLLSVEYFIQMKLEMNTVWSTNEEFVVPIDFYEPFVNQSNANPQQPQYPPQQPQYPPQQPQYPPQQPPQYPPQQPQYPPQQPPQYPPQQPQYPPQYPPQQPQYPPQYPPQQQPQYPPQYPPQQPQYPPQYPPQQSQYPPQQYQYPPQQPPQYPPQQPQYPPQYPPQQPQYPPQQPQFPPNEAPPQQEQDKKNDNDSLPTMDEILQKPDENKNKDNPAPPTGNNNNFSYPGF